MRTSTSSTSSILAGMTTDVIGLSPSAYIDERSRSREGLRWLRECGDLCRLRCTQGHYQQKRLPVVTYRRAPEIPNPACEGSIPPADQAERPADPLQPDTGRPS